MRFINSVLFAASALASFATAQSTTLFFTKFPTSVTTGETYPLEWKTNDNTTPVTITLKQGPSGDLKDVAVLTSTGENGKYSWTPSKSLSNGGNYALVITQGDQTNYGGPIALSGGTASSAAASSTPSASSASASSKSASSKSDSTLSTAASASTASSGSASASASASPSDSNSKTPSAKSASPTAAASQTTGSAATSTNDAQGAPTSTGGAATLGSSPMALIFGAAAMMAYLN